MLRLLLSDYVSNFKPAFKKAFVNNGWFMILYMLVFFPMLTRRDDGVLSMLRYYGVMMPMMIGGSVAIMYPTRLHKNMYLCPMNQEDRRSYAKLSFWFKVTLFAVISIGFNFVLCLTKVITIDILISNVIVAVAMLVTTNVSYDKLNYRDRTDSKGKNKNTCFSEWAAIIMGAVNAVVIGMSGISFIKTGIVWKVIWIGEVVLQVIFTIAFFRKRYGDIIKASESFEWAYGTVKYENNN